MLHTHYSMGPSNRLLMAARRGLMTTSSPPLLLRGLSTAAATVCRYSSPWLMLPSTVVANKFTSDSDVRSMDYSFYRLSDKQSISLHNKHKASNPISRDSYCIGSSKGWLLYIDPLDYSLFLTNPLSPSPPTVPLPPVTTLSSVHVLSPENEIEPGRFLLRHEHNIYRPQDMYFRIIGCFAISGSPDLNDSVIMVVQYGTCKLAFCKPGLNMDSWTNLDYPIGVGPIYEIVYSSKDQLFYTVHEHGDIVTWDLRGEQLKTETYEPEFPEETDFEFTGNDQCNYLVESCGDILLVSWYYSMDYDRDGNLLLENEDDYDPNLPSKTHRFCVFRLSGAKDKWEQIDSLGDRVVFLGRNEPFSLSASDFPDQVLKPNSIYFAGPCREDGDHVGEDWGIYNLEDDTITRHYPCSYWSKIRPPPIWIDRSNSEFEVQLIE